MRALTIDQVGVVTLVGGTGSAQYPTTPNAWNRLHNAPSVSDAFVTRLDMTLPRAQQLVYSTFLGGVSNDHATALVVDVTGVVTVAGFTSAADYPTTPNAWDRTYDNSARNGSPDVFVTRLDPTLPPAQQMVYSTFLGGMREDGPSAIAVDSAGTLTIAGVTTSLDYPTTPGAWDSTNSDRLRAFVTRLDVSRPAPQQLVYSTFVGGSLSVHNAARCLAVDGAGVATIAGYTESTNYPTTPNAWSRTFSGGSADAVLTRLDMLPTGVTRHGTSTAGCNGQLAASVTSMPRIGNASFALTCTNAPPSTVGVVALANGRLLTPTQVLGIDLWLDPTTIWLLASVDSDFRGAADLPLPLPRFNRLVGVTLYGQFLWLGRNAPPPCPPQGFSTTAALEITIQP